MSVLFRSGCARVCENDISVNHIVWFGESGGFVPVDAFCFEDGEEIFCHCIVIWVPASFSGLASLPTKP